MARLHVHLPGPFSVSFGGRRRASGGGGAGGGGCVMVLLALIVVALGFYVVAAVVGLVLAWWFGCGSVGFVWWLVKLSSSSGDTRWPIPLGVQFWPLRVVQQPTAAPAPAAVAVLPPTAAPPGWYVDPAYGEGLRWWDGHRWTAHTHGDLV